MEVQIARDGVIIGYLDFHELEAALEQRTILPTDHGWFEGLPDWRPLSELCTQAASSPIEQPLGSAPAPIKTPAKRNWRDDAATEKQIRFLESFGVKAPEGLTKGGASELIDKCQNDPKALRIQAAKQMADWERSMEQDRIERENKGAYWFREAVDNAALEIESLKKAGADRVATKQAKRAELADFRRQLKTSPRDTRATLEDRILDLEVWLSDLDSDMADGPSEIQDAKDDLKQSRLLRTKFWRCTFKDDWIQSSDAGEHDELVDVANTIDRLYDKYGRYFKMPTVKQITLILEALDTSSQDWDRLNPGAFFATLQHNCPDLIRSSIR